MPNTHQRKALPQANFATPIHAKCLVTVLCMLLVAASTHADTVYRCGNAYSASDQCTNGPPSEIKASAALRDRAPEKPPRIANDLQEADLLEKKRLLAEHQAAQNAPVRFNPSANHVNPNHSPERNPIPSQGRRLRKPFSPYFTAKDPNAPSKKKGNATALPSAN